MTRLHPCRPPRPARRARGLGFTLIELAVVLAVIGLLLMLVAPRYFGAVERSQATVLQHNMHQIRVAIDQFYADRDRYPERLEELVELRYLRQIPINPVTQTPDWITIQPPPGRPGAVYDVQLPGAEPADAASEPSH